jgi:hypothetical protein
VVDEKKMLFLSNIHRAMTTKKKDYRKSQDQRYHVPTTTES